MIRMIKEQSVPVIRLDPTNEPAHLPWQPIKQEVEKWVRAQPTLSLVLAVSVGAALAWLIKRRS
jgi:hypothetical protein